MRVGKGLHAGLTSIVGRSGGFSPLQIGGSVLGGETIIGRPGIGMQVGKEGPGPHTRVG